MFISCCCWVFLIRVVLLLLLDKASARISMKYPLLQTHVMVQPLSLPCNWIYTCKVFATYFIIHSDSERRKNTRLVQTSFVCVSWTFFPGERIQFILFSLCLVSFSGRFCIIQCAHRENCRPKGKHGKNGFRVCLAKVKSSGNRFKPFFPNQDVKSQRKWDIYRANRMGTSKIKHAAKTCFGIKDS